MFETITAAIPEIVSFVREFVQNNWSFVMGLIVGYLVYCLCANAKVVVGIILVGILISVLTNAGVIPPINQIFEEVKALAG